MIFEPFSFLLMTALAILNATLPEQDFPIEITANPVTEEGGDSTPTVATPIPGLSLDAATITAMAAVAGGAWAAFKKNAGRTNAAADTTVRLADSVKATDYGAADTASILAEALQSLSNMNAEMSTALQTTTQKAVNNAKSWNVDNKEYYENLPTAPRPGELEKDKIKTKLAQVNKITEKTPDP